eukprot:6289804-Amphidinium_carterae.5
MQQDKWSHHVPHQYGRYRSTCTVGSFMISLIRCPATIIHGKSNPFLDTPDVHVNRKGCVVNRAHERKAVRVQLQSPADRIAQL